MNCVDVEMNPHYTNTSQLFFQNGYQAYNVGHNMHPITIEDIDLASRNKLKLVMRSFMFSELRKE
jgi:hypothetical protein